MANMDHVQLVKRGRDAVANWREEHPGEALDLNAAYMSHTRIPQVDVSGSDLRNSDLMGTMLRRANLSACLLNPCHMYRADLREANLTRALLNGANLRGADLRGADLSDTDMDNAIVSDANLTGAILRGANMSRINLKGANLTGADLTGANLSGADLSRANLTDAKLDGADFFEAILNNPVLSGADFAGSLMGYTVLQNCDLADAAGLDRVRHDAPSTIGIDTIVRSKGQITGDFLQGAGVPESLLAIQQSLGSESTPTGHCFISCCDRDLPFAQGLQTNLRARGINCWVFSESSRGNPLVDRRSTSEEEEIERWVRYYEKLVVVCTDHSLETEALRNDITQATELQQSRDQWTLYLVSPDETMIQPRARTARSLSFEHMVFDLRGQEANTAEYQGELDRLTDNLKQTQPASADRPAS